MRTLIFLLVCMTLMTGCLEGVKPNIPEQVIVTVEKYKPLPTWATDQLIVPMPADGTVGARLETNNKRGLTLDIANCHRRLLAKLDRGETVNDKECDTGPFN